MGKRLNNIIESNFVQKLSDPENSRWAVPTIAIVLGFLLGVVITALTLVNPLGIFTALIQAITGLNINALFTGGRLYNIRYFGEFFVFSMPLILAGLSVAFAFRAGLFNIGTEGQMLVGSCAAISVGIIFDLPFIIQMPLTILAAIVGGSLWGFIPGFLKAKFNVHEVVVTIMLNYAALYTTNYVYRSLPGGVTNNRTVPISESSSLKSEFLSAITGNSRFHWGFIIVIIAVIVFYIIINKTNLGFELRSVGFNKHASKYAGMKVDRNIILSMVISGAFAGLAGLMISNGTFDYGRILVSAEGYGFDGITVALVGGNTAVGSVLGGFLIGALKAGQPLMQNNGVPRDIAIIISSSIVLFVAMQHGVKHILKNIRKKEEE